MSSEDKGLKRELGNPISLAAGITSVSLSIRNNPIDDCLGEVLIPVVALSLVVRFIEVVEIKHDQ